MRRKLLKTGLEVQKSYSNADNSAWISFSLLILLSWVCSSFSPFDSCWQAEGEKQSVKLLKISSQPLAPRLTFSLSSAIAFNFLLRFLTFFSFAILAASPPTSAAPEIGATSTGAGAAAAGASTTAEPFPFLFPFLPVPALVSPGGAPRGVFLVGFGAEAPPAPGTVFLPPLPAAPGTECPLVGAPGTSLFLAPPGEGDDGAEEASLSSLL